MLGDRQKTSEVLISLLDILSKLHTSYRAEKIRRSSLTFNDLEQLSLELLLDDKGGRTALSKEYPKNLKRYSSTSIRM